MVGVLVVMATSFKRTYVSMLYSKSVVFSIVFKRTVVFSAPDSMAGLCGLMLLLETPGHSQASLAQSLVESLLLSPGSWCTKSFVVPSKNLFP